MPTYDFKCKKCGQIEERTQGMNDPNPSCTVIIHTASDPEMDGSHECGGDTEKVFSGKAASVHFQGGGWAKDGYSKK